MPEQPQPGKPEENKPEAADDATVLRSDDATVLREQAEPAGAATEIYRDDAAAPDKTTVYRDQQDADPDKTTVYRSDAADGGVVDANAPTQLSGHQQATKVASAATYSTAKFLAEDAREAADLEIGAVLKDRFVIEKVLGRGGMGVVYLALDLRKQEARDRHPHVALKALSDSYQRDEKMVISLQRESQKAQSLAHPNIATVYDFDRQGSLVYLTMEVLTGSPLDDFIKDHPTGLAPERVAPMVRGMCLGLAYAHNKGIVHSDFKPGNVFVGAKDNPKILDFGIARAAPVNETQNREASSETEFDAGELGALTPSYAAKEMFFGADPHPSDDVYALAITVYQLLTGQHPFDAKPAPQAEAEGLKPAPIGGIKRREWRAIRHGLAFNRNERQQHAAEFLREFEGQSKLRLVAGVAVFLGLAFAGYFGFVQVQEQARIAPDIPFESLNGEVQSRVTEYLNDGQGLESFQDYAGALTQYRNAYELHPRNPVAVEHIVALMESLRDIALATDNPEIAANLLQNLNDLMETDGFLSTHDTLKAIRSELEELI